MAKKPNVFVSSTFFDLRQVRDDIRLFLEGSLGYSAMLSETASFPVDPDHDSRHAPAGAGARVVRGESPALCLSEIANALRQIAQ